MQEWIIAMLVISVLLILRDMAKTILTGRMSKKEEIFPIGEDHPQKEKVERYAAAFQKLADALDVQHEDLLNLDNLLKSETVPERIKRMRRLRGITQEELGKMVGTTKSTISICESGRNELRSTTLARIAEALGVSYEYLVLGKPQDGDFLQEGLTPFKKVPVVLAAVEEFGDDHRLVFRTLTIRVPNDGLDWHVMGEVKTDCQQNGE